MTALNDLHALPAVAHRQVVRSNGAEALRAMAAVSFVHLIVVAQVAVETLKPKQADFESSLSCFCFSFKR